MTDGSMILTGGLSLGTIITVVLALHKITDGNLVSLERIMSDKIDNLQKGWDKEAERLRENTNKTEMRLGETTLRAETKMKEEADKVREQFLANNATIKDQMDIRFREVHGLLDRSKERI